MEGLLLTQSSAPIVGQISWLLGHLMNGIFSVLSNVFHIENIGLCIIIFTIIIYTASSIDVQTAKGVKTDRCNESGA